MSILTLNCSRHLASRLLLARGLRTAVASRAESQPKAEVHPVYFKLKETQKLYQQDNGLLIHERNGPVGRALYYLTLALSAYGLFEMLCFFYRGMYPPKPQ